MSSVTTSRLICGLDEVGRGPLAGPLVAAAVIFARNFDFTEEFPALKFTDSKKLTRRQREETFTAIRDSALLVEYEVITVKEINAQGIGWANRAVFERLIMRVEASYYIVDGRLKFSNLGRKAPLVESVIDADETEQTVSAASIVAKVQRDRIMRVLHRAFPFYGWDHNAGYGTAEHIAAIQEHGACVHHRRRFVETALNHKAVRWLPGFEKA